MKESASSKNWKRRQAKDPFVKKAQKENYRARSIYKLEEIDRQYNLFKAAKTVIDLGSAPGAWTQYTLKRTSELNKKVKVIALDLLAMQVIEEVHFIQGDFNDEQTLQTLQSAIGESPIELILSDMAPNMSGIRSVDDARAMNLCESVIEFSEQYLINNGNLVCKVFQGYYFEDFLATVRKKFHKVHCVKPESSRAQSREMYIVALNKKN